MLLISRLYTNVVQSSEFDGSFIEVNVGSIKRGSSSDSSSFTSVSPLTVNSLLITYELAYSLASKRCHVSQLLEDTRIQGTETGLILS